MSWKLIEITINARVCAACHIPCLPAHLMRELPGVKSDEVRTLALHAGYDVVCDSCAKAGAYKVKCAVCLTERPYDDMQQTFGEPPEYLCKHCYGLLPAKLWDQAVSRLSKAHEYDFE